MTLTRYFGCLMRSQVEHLSAVLGQFVFGQLKRPTLGATLDLDSTAFGTKSPSCAAKRRSCRRWGIHWAICLAIRTGIPRRCAV